MAVHEDDVGAAEVAAARGIVEGGVVVDLPALVADGKMCVVERGSLHSDFLMLQLGGASG